MYSRPQGKLSNPPLQWKKLNEEERKQFDVRAQIIAEERERADKVKGTSGSVA